VDDVEAALRKGDLKFTLDGYKLKGSWVLVKTRGGPGGDPGRSWLLIKHRDDWSGAVDIAEFAPLSVKSEGDFVDILAKDNPAVWISHRPAEGGETGAMFKRIIERALELRDARTAAPAEKKPSPARAAKKLPAPRKRAPAAKTTGSARKAKRR
jgi:bifunctional non-homologous end joining protein LigD